MSIHLRQKKCFYANGIDKTERVRGRRHGDVDVGGTRGDVESVTKTFLAEALIACLKNPKK
jgi:hypothetical protein